MVGEVAERGSQVGLDLGRSLPRQRPDVDVERDRVGITLAFITPPSIRFGENVVCVQAWRWAAAPTLGSSSSAASTRSGSSSASFSSGGRFIDSTRAGHSSWKRGAGRYSASRWTTAAAFTSALSMRNGIEP